MFALRGPPEGPRPKRRVLGWCRLLLANESASRIGPVTGRAQGIAPTMRRLRKPVRAWWQRNVSFPSPGHSTLYVIRQQSLTWSGSSCTHPFVQRPLLYGVTGLLATPRLGNASTDPLRSVYTILLIEQAHLLVCFPPARAKLPQVTARLLVPGSTWRVRSPVGRPAHHRAGALLPLMPRSPPVSAWPRHVHSQWAQTRG